MRSLLLAPLLWAALLSGCATETLWKSKPASDDYVERVSSVLISKDGKTLVIVGSNYHYIFEAPPTIVRTLTSDYQRYVGASLGTFTVDGAQRLTGTFVLHLRDDAPDGAKTSAKNAGFVEDASGYLRSDGVLSGTRYDAGNVNIGADARALNREYHVNINVPRSQNADLPRKLLLTPLTVAVDGVLIAGGIALVVVAMPFVAAHEIVCRGTEKCGNR